MGRTKIILLGFDGATFDLIKPWVDKGKFPSLKKLIETGSWGDMESTIPPITSTAWVSLITGKNPGKHGVFDFVNFHNGIEETINRKHVKGKMLWELLSQYGKKIGIVNFPVSYPPNKFINGFVISGMFSPPNYVYPDALREELLKNVPEYSLMPEFDAYPQSEDTQNKPVKYIEKLLSGIESQQAVSKYLLEEKDWDVFIDIFMFLDRIQHFFWKYRDIDHSRFNKKNGDNDVVFEFYKKMDNIIGDFLKYVDNNTYLIVVSDHGFGPLEQFFYVNTWLEKNGYFSFKKSTSLRPSGLQRRLLAFDITAEKILAILKFIKLESMTKLVPSTIKRRVPRKTFLTTFVLSEIDWKRTIAYFPTYPGMGIRLLNVDEKEFQGRVKHKEYGFIRNRIIEELLNIRDPNTGRKIIDKAIKREELYVGDQISKAPDILLLPREGYALKDGYDENIITPSIHESKLDRSGDHRLNGICLIKGPLIKRKKKIENVKIIDITPTVLYLLGLSIPRDIDGRVLKEIFKDESEPTMKNVIYKGAKDEEDSIRRRIKELKDMGKI